MSGTFGHCIQDIIDNKGIVPWAPAHGIWGASDHEGRRLLGCPDRAVAKDDAFNTVMVIGKIIHRNEQLRRALVKGEDQIIAHAIERHDVRADIWVEQDGIRVARRVVLIQHLISTGVAPKAIGIVPSIPIEHIIPLPPIERVIPGVAIEDVRLGAAVDDVGEVIPSEAKGVCGILHQLALCEGRIAKRVCLAQVEPSVLDDDLIRRVGIGPIGQDEILRWVGTDHTRAKPEILWANLVRKTEGR